MHSARPRTSYARWTLAPENDSERSSMLVTIAMLMRC
jgi:hypothetical protein